jgi:GNAT superfamily N-acetyltransferase
MVVAQQHFFSEAPVLRWVQWLWRQVWPINTQTAPSRVSLESFRAQDIQIPTGVRIQATLPERAAVYAGFLGAHYTLKTDPHSLTVPIESLQSWLNEKSLLGAEALDADGHLIGLLFSSYAGTLLDTENVVITWFCIHPLWRRTGVGNALLRTIVKLNRSQTVYWWRTDGLLQSPIPAVFTQQRMTRQRRPIRSDIGTFALRVEKQSFATWRPKVISSWQKHNPTGLVLDDAHASASLRTTEVWVMRSPGLTLALVVQPTFERHRGTGYTWCEILWWVVETNTRTSTPLSSTDYSVGLYCEAMLDNLPYGWFEAPTSLPHIDGGWVTTRQQNWSVLGLDPGIPVQRPILSLLAV